MQAWASVSALITAVSWWVGIGESLNRPEGDK